MAGRNQFSTLGVTPEQVFLTDPDNIWFMKGVSPSPQFIPSRPLSPRPLLLTLALFIPITLLVIQLAPTLDADTWLRLGIIALIVALVIAFVVIDRVRTPRQLVRGWPEAVLIVGQLTGCTATRGEVDGYPSYRVTVRYTYRLSNVESAEPINAVETFTRNDLDGKPLPKPNKSVIIVHFPKPIQTDWFAKRQDFIL